MLNNTVSETVSNSMPNQKIQSVTMQTSKRIISVIGRDFRLNDNPFFEGWKEHEIIPVFILDPFNQEEHGSNLKSLFFEYVLDFKRKLEEKNSHLYIVKLDDFESFLLKSKADAVRYSFDGEPNTLKRGHLIENICKRNFVKFISLWNFLIKPEKGSFRHRFNDFYTRVFKPSMESDRIKTIDPPIFLKTPKIEHQDEPLPSYNKRQNIIKLWFKDEKSVLMSFSDFLKKNLSSYHINRDLPAVDGTSKLSPYLRIGVVSIRQIYKMVKEHPQSEPFLRELAWAEFFRVWLSLHPFVIEREFRKEWIDFPWERNLELFEKWKKGETGFDLVDAGMTQLMQEGWIHNRVRMVVASFLTKNLLLDWRLGERFFYENLVDADLAANVGNWQWIAGCGLDAAPYFRIFNPELQLKKFDPKGNYVSKYVNEKHAKIVELERSRLNFLRIAKEFRERWNLRKK